MCNKIEYERYILRNLLTVWKGSDHYRSFIDLCKMRYVEENARFLESVYASINSSYVYAMFIKDNPINDNFNWQINISAADRNAIETFVVLFDMLI